MLYFLKNILIYTLNVNGLRKPMKSDFKKRKLQTHGYRCKDSLKILNPVIIQIHKMLQPSVVYYRNLMFI